MKLQTRLILSFIVGLALVISIAQTIQYVRMSTLGAWMAENNTALVRDMVEQNARNIFESVERAVSTSLERGEMEKFDRLVKEQKRVPGLLEFSLYDRKGKLYTSTVVEELKMSDRHPTRNGKTITENCLRCHEVEKLGLKGKAIPANLMEKVQGMKSMMLRQGQETIEIFQPQRVTADCIRCHHDWKEGDVAGTTHFKFSKAALTKLEGEIAEGLSRLEREILFTSLLMILGIVAVLTPLAYWYTRKNLVKRLKNLGGSIERMALGHLEQIEVPARRDEIWEIAVHVNTMAGNLERTAASVGRQSETADRVVAAFTEASGELREGAERANALAGEALRENVRLVERTMGARGDVSQAAGNIDAISGAVEEVSGAVTTIAAAAEEASQNVTTMASAAEEMTANIAEVHNSLARVNESVGRVTEAMREMSDAVDGVRTRCQTASRQSSQADRQAQEAGGVMTRLSASAQEINQVVQVINDIAEQTNMLALNAAIEAAGAGDAGKGFAVVANEVKELARQTTDATRMIADQVEEIRQNAVAAADSALAITGIVRQINQSNQEIEYAVDGQRAAAQRVSASMEEVSRASGMVTINAQELKSAAAEVARAAAEAASGTSEIARSSSRIAGQSQDVALQSGDARMLTQSALGAVEEVASLSGAVKERMGEASQLTERMLQMVEGLSGLGEEMRQSAEQLRAAQRELNQTSV
ncbi:MAG: hypothetical protein HQL51_08550 [Magnetococcales bacterium]|nr:hypothetical protein [Magnetococcales bacterium]